MAVVKSLHITQPFDKEPISTEKIEVFLEGIKHDRHFGITKLSGVREAKIVPKGRTVLNIRSVTVVSTEELKEIAKKLNVKNITASDLEANIEIEGIKDFTKLPVGTMLKFPRELVLFITGENFPCVIAGGRVAKRLKDKDLSWKFPKPAFHLRGLIAIPFSSGIVKVGDEVEVIPVNNFN